jgi:hypothetical protein
MDSIMCLTLVDVLSVVDVFPHSLHLLPSLYWVSYAVSPFLPLKITFECTIPQNTALNQPKFDLKPNILCGLFVEMCFLRT